MKKLITLLLLTIITLPMMAFDDEDYQKFAREVESGGLEEGSFHNSTIVQYRQSIIKSRLLSWRDMRRLESTIATASVRLALVR